MRTLLRIVCLFCAFAVSSRLQAQSYVQAAFKDTGVSGTVTATFSKPTAAGNTYIVFVAVDLRHGDLMKRGPADTEGNTFRLVLADTSPNRTTKQYVYDRIGAIGGTNDSIHLSATTSINVAIIELQGANSLDQKAEQGGIGNTAISPNVTIAHEKEIAVGVMSGNPSAPFPGFNQAAKGWTRTAVAGGTQSAQYQNLAKAQSDVSAAVNLNPGALPPNTDWLAAILTYSAEASSSH